MVEITKNHEVYIPKRGVFHEAFSMARLKTISAVSSELTKIKDSEGKTLKVDTYSIMHDLEEEISGSDIFTGRKMPE
jgi:hypothetical protein